MSQLKVQNLESARLYYEPLSLRHLSHDYVSWLNDPEVNRYLETGGDYTIGKLSDYLEECERKAMFFWAIHLKSSKKHIGNIKIDPISWRHGTGEYGLLLGAKSEWRKGFAEEASRIILDHCFNDLHLRKITLGVVADNKPAVDLYHRLAFEVEGVYKKHGMYDGKFCDVIRMAIFNPTM